MITGIPAGSNDTGNVSLKIFLRKILQSPSIKFFLKPVWSAGMLIPTVIILLRMSHKNSIVDNIDYVQDS